MSKLYTLDLSADSRGDRKPAPVPLSREAKDLFRAFVDAHGEEHGVQAGDLAAAFSKLEGYAARFALLFAMVRYATGEIRSPIEEVDARSMAVAIQLARWFAHEAKRVYHLVDLSDAERERNELVEWIRCKGGTVTPRDLQRCNARYRDPGTADVALRDLATRGRGRMVPVPAGPKGGRPSEVFTLPSDEPRQRLNIVKSSLAPLKLKAKASFVDCRSLITYKRNTPDEPRYTRAEHVLRDSEAAANCSPGRAATRYL